LGTLDNEEKLFVLLVLILLKKRHARVSSNCPIFTL
jgi:hypothetical protein